MLLSIFCDMVIHPCVSIEDVIFRTLLRNCREGSPQAGLEISITPSYVNMLIRKNENVVNKTFLAMMEALGYDVELTYVKREE